MISLYDHQRAAIDLLHPGAILVGGVGSGKSLTALAYYFRKFGGTNPVIKPGTYHKMKDPKKLYIITTARKRDSLDWEREATLFGIKPIVDSWNNIKNYITVENSFFFFDEQRVVGKGSWVKSFLKITKSNEWIMLSATPGDNWEDYIPVMVANGYYKNRTEFTRNHVVYNPYTKFPKVDRYVEVAKLIRIRNEIVVNMQFIRKTKRHMIDVFCDYDRSKMQSLVVDRWNIYDEVPIKDGAQLYRLMRMLVNSDESRLAKLSDIVHKHKKVIVFYNFNYELDLLISFALNKKLPFSQWNGHRHESILKGEDTWLYLCQYMSASEAWNAIETDAMVFYSQTYSYRTREQSSGRIDRLNTTFTDLYYYTFTSYSMIDMAINKAVVNKKTFNESRFIDELNSSQKKHMV